MPKSSSHDAPEAASEKSALAEYLKKAIDGAQARTDEWRMGFEFVRIAKGHAELFNLGVDEAIPVIRETLGGWSAIDFLCDPETEIRAHWDRVHTPVGRGPVEAAIEAADATPLTLPARSKGYSRFITAVRHLQLQRPGGSIPLPTEKLGAALGCNRHTVEQYIDLGQRDQFLGLFLKAVPRQRAAEFLVDTRKVLAASAAKPATSGVRKSKAENPPPVVSGNSLEKPDTSSSVLQVLQVLPNGNLAKNLSSKEEQPKTDPGIWTQLYTEWEFALPRDVFFIVKYLMRPKAIVPAFLIQGDEGPEVVTEHPSAIEVVTECLSVVLSACNPPDAIRIFPFAQKMVRIAKTVDPSIAHLSIEMGQA